MSATDRGVSSHYDYRPLQENTHTHTASPCVFVE